MPQNTVARLKLMAAIAASSAQDVHRRSGVEAGALRLLAAGLSEPRASTMRRLRDACGIDVGDWFVDAEAHS